MDSFSTDCEEEVIPGPSMSLISYGSDFEASLDESFPNLQRDTSKTITEEETLEEHRCANDLVYESLAERAKQMSKTGLSAKKLKELQQAMAVLEAAKTKYHETRVVYQAAKDVTGPDSKLPKPLINTVRKMFLRDSLTDHVHAGKGADAGVLGLKEDHLWADCPEQLSESDQKVLRLAVESQLIANANKLKKSESTKKETLSKLLGRDPDCVSSAEEEHTVKMASLRAELDKELSIYYKKLNKLDSLLESIVLLRTDEMDTNCLKTIEGIKVKAEALKQKSKLTSAELCNAIYTEDEDIPTALKRLGDELNLLITETRAELSKLTAERAAYERVQGPQFDSMLNEYRAVKSQLKRLKYCINNMKIN